MRPGLVGIKQVFSIAFIYFLYFFLRQIYIQLKLKYILFELNFEHSITMSKANLFLNKPKFKAQLRPIAGWASLDFGLPSP